MSNSAAAHYYLNSVCKLFHVIQSKNEREGSGNTFKIDKKTITETRRKTEKREKANILYNHYEELQAKQGAVDEWMKGGQGERVRCL